VINVVVKSVYGEEVLRVTARKDKYGEVENNADGSTGWICNSCRYDHKKTSDWVIDGPTHVDKHSVISANHYENLLKLTVDTKNKLKQFEGKYVSRGEGALNPNNK
jgi:NADH-quinone oxidoreductase subunit G